MNIVQEYISSILRRYVGEYLDNFNTDMFKLNILKGEIELKNLQLNNKILDNVPIPLKMKYGRVGLIKIGLPSVI